MLYPLKFRPVYKDYLWGGRNLEKLGKTIPDGIVAESWEVSAHPDGVSVIANGEFAGMTLPEFLAKFGRQAVGTALPEGYIKNFPLLLKLIDANQKLSVQVHPNDDYARAHEGGYGKNEMWYVISAASGSEIIYDVVPGVDRDSFQKAVRENKIGSCLKKVPVNAGDAFNIPAGIVHGLGAGIVLAEIQQSSNLTYRIYDYDRTDVSGKKRPLHLEKALEVIDFNSAGREPKLPLKTENYTSVSTKTGLVVNNYFGVELFGLKGKLRENTNGKRFYIYMFLEGSGKLIYEDGLLTLKAVESVLIPAALKEYTLEGNLKYLKVFIPG